MRLDVKRAHPGPRQLGLAVFALALALAGSTARAQTHTPVQILPVQIAPVQVLPVQVSPIDGQWLTPAKDAVIEIAACVGQPTRCARLVWIKPAAGKPNEILRDVNNPNAELKNRELCGLEIITGLKPVAAGSYDGAVLYDPEGGQTVTGAVKRVGPNVKITGYLASFGPMLSESQVLTPVGKNFTPCVGSARATDVPAAPLPPAAASVPPASGKPAR